MKTASTTERQKSRQHSCPEATETAAQLEAAAAETEAAEATIEIEAANTAEELAAETEAASTTCRGAGSKDGLRQPALQRSRQQR